MDALGILVKTLTYPWQKDGPFEPWNRTYGPLFDEVEKQLIENDSKWYKLLVQIENGSILPNRVGFIQKMESIPSRLKEGLEEKVGECSIKIITSIHRSSIHPVLTIFTGQPPDEINYVELMRPKKYNLVLKPYDPSYAVIVEDFDYIPVDSLYLKHPRITKINQPQNVLEKLLSSKALVNTILSPPTSAPSISGIQGGTRLYFDIKFGLSEFDFQRLLDKIEELVPPEFRSRIPEYLRTGKSMNDLMIPGLRYRVSEPLLKTVFKIAANALPSKEERKRILQQNPDEKGWELLRKMKEMASSWTQNLPLEYSIATAAPSDPDYFLFKSMNMGGIMIALDDDIFREDTNDFIIPSETQVAIMQKHDLIPDYKIDPERAIKEFVKKVGGLSDVYGIEGAWARDLFTREAVYNLSANQARIRGREEIDIDEVIKAAGNFCDSLIAFERMMQLNQPETWRNFIKRITNPKLSQLIFYTFKRILMSGSKKTEEIQSIMKDERGLTNEQTDEWLNWLKTKGYVIRTNDGRWQWIYL